jgi:hypothetical protein
MAAGSVGLAFSVGEARHKTSVETLCTVWADAALRGGTDRNGLTSKLGCCVLRASWGSNEIDSLLGRDQDGDW